MTLCLLCFCNLIRGLNPYPKPSKSFILAKKKIRRSLRSIWIFESFGPRKDLSRHLIQLKFFFPMSKPYKMWDFPLIQIDEEEEENSSKVYPWLNFGSFYTSLKTGQLVFTQNQEVSGFSCTLECTGGMIYEIFINYMTEILSLRLEITVCTLVSLGLLVKSSRQIQVQKSVVRRLHAIFRSKVAGSPGGGVTTWYQSCLLHGNKIERLALRRNWKHHAFELSIYRVMPPRTGRRRRQNQDEMQGPTQGRSIGESRNKQFARTTQKIGRPDRAEPSDPEKAYGIERLKKLGATMFEGSTDPADAEKWFNMLEKCFDVMNCREERKVRLATFLLQKEAEGWWKSILARRSDARALD
uniref:Uncharacterized protein n=1 Tax=Cucumis melo TaxID=3656 RepID=A0A9I9EEC0_CUCME